MMIVFGRCGGVAESDKIATLMWAQFHAYCFSLSEDRKAIAIFIDQFKRQKICGRFFSPPSIQRHAPNSPYTAHVQPKQKRSTFSIRQQVGQNNRTE